jgi:hypothetical protein
MALGVSHGCQYTGDMTHTVCLLELNIDSEEAVTLVINRLSGNGFQTTRSFDLQIARAAHTDCACPHHGTHQCDCQLIVLLVYEDNNPPATLVLHTRDSRTQIFLVITPDMHLRKDLINPIRSLIASIQVSPVEGCKYET